MPSRSRRLQRLAEELEEAGLNLGDEFGLPRGQADLVLEEVDHAMRPPVHERRVPSSGTIIEPASDPASWSEGTQLDIGLIAADDQPLDAARWFADGLSCWLVRYPAKPPQWLIFDRPAGSERDLGVIARTMAATIVQRHPDGAVRVVGGFGVLRWDGYRWLHEPPVNGWIDLVTTQCQPQHIELLHTLLEFAVHDLGSAGIGALLIYRTGATEPTGVEPRLPVPPPLHVGQPTHLAPIRHALSQIDGAAVFDRHGVLRQLGVRLIPSNTAESDIDGFKGTRHTSGRRYSYDDPEAIVIAVSEDGPVSVFHQGAILGRSPVEVASD